jgi:preprotein translocase subunit SecY
MLKTLMTAWKTVEIRKKILFTFLVVIIFRVGAHLPVPFLDAGALGALIADSGSIMNILDTFSGGALSQGTLFALSIQPYINASIIMQLLTYALPPLENLQKEGEAGHKKIQFITSLVALGISLVMSYAYYVTMKNLGAVQLYSSEFANTFIMIIIIAAFAAGAQLVVWLGNQINENGLGSGISIILLTGIISRGPIAIINMFKAALAPGQQNLFIAIFFIGVFFVGMVGFIVFMNDSERRIPVQYAKRVVGRKQYGGQSSFIPVKIAMSGVMPIIFAMALMSFPSTLELFIKRPTVPETFWEKLYVGLLNFFNYNSPWYAVLYFVLIIAFNFFYVSMQYDPTKIANQLRTNNGGIPGIRPGKPTADYIKRVLNKITIVGAFFLGVIAIVPILTGLFITEIRISMGGTTILIIVSVILETVRMLESQMMMRHHRGFLE